MAIDLNGEVNLEAGRGMSSDFQKRELWCFREVINLPKAFDFGENLQKWKRHWLPESVGKNGLGKMDIEQKLPDSVKTIYKRHFSPDFLQFLVVFFTEIRNQYFNNSNPRVTQQVTSKTYKLFENLG